MYLAVVYPGVKSSEPTPMADESKDKLLTWLRLHAQGHSFTLWEMDGVQLRKVAYYHNYNN